jgi:hypothetical protein
VFPLGIRDKLQGDKLNEYRGRCHCGNLSWALRSKFSQSELPVRACLCSFCRKHAAISTSDPLGSMNFAVQDARALIRYRFATETAEFLVCARCGIYIGAQIEEHGRFYGIANLRLFEGESDFAARAEPMDYSGESSDARRSRRVRRWTPVDLPV